MSHQTNTVLHLNHAIKMVGR